MGRITTGEYSYGSIKMIGQRGHIYIGKFTSIADNVVAIMVGHNPNNVSTYPFNKYVAGQIPWPKAANSKSHPLCYGDIHIGSDCWIGYGAVLFGGVKIGDGAIVAANSIVTRDVIPYQIVAGSPAGLVSMRFGPNPYYAQKLLEIKWWNWPIEKIAENADLLCNEKIEEFIKLHGVKNENSSQI